MICMKCSSARVANRGDRSIECSNCGYISFGRGSFLADPPGRLRRMLNWIAR